MNESAEQIAHRIRNRTWREYRKIRKERKYFISASELAELERLASNQHAKVRDHN